MDQLLMILHARVSTPRQKTEGYGLDRQLRENREYAKQLNATVVAEIASDFANEGEDREDLDQIKKLLKNGTANAVMFFDLDRSTRGGLGDWYLLTREIQELGGTIYFGHRRAKAGESPEEKAMDDVYAVFANLDKARIRNRTMGGFRSKVLRGEWPGHGKVNYGYKRIGETKHTAIAPDETTSKIIQDLFNRLTGWNGREKQGVTSIKREFEQLGIVSPSGSSKWSLNSIYKMLRNPIYKGTAQPFTWKSQGYIRSKNKKRYIKVTKRPLSERLSVQVPALISELQWELAQQLLDQGIQNSPRKMKYDYLLAKRIKCGMCGCTMRGKKHNQRNLQHYRCHGKESAYAHTCTMSVVQVPILDTQVWNWIEQRFLTEENRVNTLETVNIPDTQDTQIEQLRGRLAKLEEEDANLRRQARKGIITDEEFAQGRAEVKQERISLQETIARLEQRKANALLMEHYKTEVSTMLTRYKAHFHGLPFTARKKLIEALDIRVMIWTISKGLFKIEIRSIFEYSPETDTWEFQV